VGERNKKKAYKNLTNLRIFHPFAEKPPLEGYA